MKLVSSSDSDEPVAIDPPPPSRSRSGTAQPKASTSTSTSASASTSGAGTRAASKSTPLVALSSDEVIALDAPPVNIPQPRRRGRPRKNVPVPESRDEDEEIVFVKETARDLANRFAYEDASQGKKSSGSLPTSKSTSTSTSASDAKARKKATPAESTAATCTSTASGSLTLYPAPKSIPPPDWLGKPAVLLQLQKCVVCHAHFAPKKSGPDRWKHISSCLPPLYRPPNPPPDLKKLISDALQPARDVTLLAHRTARAEDERRDTRKLRKLNVTTVTASYTRKEWESEVASRVNEIVGEPEPRRRRRSRSNSGSRSSSRSSTASPPRAKRRSLGSSGSSSSRHASPYQEESATYRSPSPQHPPTQPLGDESSLASEYARPPRRTPSPEPLLQAPPAIGLSQAVRVEFEREEADRSQRAELALSQAIRRRHLLPDEYDDDGGGMFSSSQVPATAVSASTSRSPSVFDSQPPSRPASEPAFHGGRFATPTPTPPGSTPPFRNGGTRGPGRFPSQSVEEQERGRAARRLSPGHAASDALEGLAISSPVRWKLASSPGRREVIEILSSSDEGEVQEEAEGTELDDEDDAGEDAWGDDAVLCWDGAEPAQSSSGEWGSGACMEWNGDRDRVDVGDKDEGDKDDDDEDEDDDGGMGEWHDIDAVDDTNDNDTHEQGTGDCPDYASWTVLKLQRLVTAYGYRSTKDHAALVRLATACWEAQAGVKATKTLAGGSADETKQKKKSKKPPAAEPGTEKSLDQQFYSMIHDDPEFYIRVLRYEPIAFDELVSRALRAGIKGRGWKDELKQFMDARGVSYYTSDPTAPRRRH